MVAGISSSVSSDQFEPMVGITDPTRSTQRVQMPLCEPMTVSCRLDSETSTKLILPSTGHLDPANRSQYIISLDMDKFKV